MKPGEVSVEAVDRGFRRQPVFRAFDPERQCWLNFPDSLRRWSANIWWRSLRAMYDNANFRSRNDPQVMSFVRIIRYSGRLDYRGLRRYTDVYRHLDPEVYGV